jgi:hypothetical protein
MTDQPIFPRTLVGGVSLPRLLIGSNWFLGYSHTSLAKDRFIKEYQSRERITNIICTFLEYGVDAVMGPSNPDLDEAICDAEQRSGKPVIRIYTPGFDLTPAASSGPNPGMSAEQVFDQCAAFGAAFCMPHQCITDALLDRRAGIIRDLDIYTQMIRQRGMIPGLSTHMSETIVYADRQNADVETYVQLYNAAGFLLQVETDWVMHIIQNARKPVMTIKPLAAGRILPPVGFAFVWSTIRDCDMVTIGTTTPYEAREAVEISLALLEKRIPDIELQKTRSKKTLE